MNESDSSIPTQDKYQTIAPRVFPKAGGKSRPFL